MLLGYVDAINFYLVLPTQVFHVYCFNIGNDENRKKKDNCPPKLNGDGVCVVLNRGITRYCTNGGTFKLKF